MIVGFRTGKVASYSCEVGYTVPNKIKIQISNKQSVNLAKLGQNASDPDNETQFVLVRDGSLAMASYSKAKLMKDIQTWTNFIVHVFINLCCSTPCFFYYSLCSFCGCSLTDNVNSNVCLGCSIANCACSTLGFFIVDFAGDH